MSSDHGSQISKEEFIARNGKTHVVIKTKLFLSSSKETLEVKIGQKRDRNYVSAPIFSYINREVSLWYIKWEIIFFISYSSILLSQARASLQNMPKHCCLTKFCRFLENSHFLEFWVIWREKLFVVFVERGSWWIILSGEV